MSYYLILFRSLTYAQRGAAALERAGITAQIMRAPKSVSKAGCGYCIRISQRWFPDALQILRRTGLDPLQVYRTSGGGYEEVAL